MKYLTIRFFVICVCGLVAACGSVPKLELGGVDPETLRVKDVQVSVDPAAEMEWYKAAAEYAKKEKGLSYKRVGARRDEQEDPQAAANNEAFRKVVRSPEAKAYMRRKASAVVREKVRAAFVPWPRGSRPVIVKVEVQGVRISSEFNQIVAGSPVSVVVGDVSLVDAASGQQIAPPKRTVGTTQDATGLLGLATNLARDNRMNRASEAFANAIIQAMKKK